MYLDGKEQPTVKQKALLGFQLKYFLTSIEPPILILFLYENKKEIFNHSYLVFSENKQKTGKGHLHGIFPVGEDKKLAWKLFPWGISSRKTHELHVHLDNNSTSELFEVIPFTAKLISFKGKSRMMFIRVCSFTVVLIRNRWCIWNNYKNFCLEAAHT